MELTGEMGVDAHVAKTGLKIVNTLHTSTLLDGVLQLRNGRVFNLDFNLPQDRMEIFNAEYVEPGFVCIKTLTSFEVFRQILYAYWLDACDV